MRCAAVPMMAAALLLGGGSGGAVAAPVPARLRHPGRVMSIDQCADQLLLALLPPARITSVTWLSRDPETSPMAGAAAHVPANHGLAEEVLRQRPDLVLAGTYSATATRALLKRLGWPLVEVAPADSIGQIRANVRLVANAVGEPARGERLLAGMDRQLAALRAHPVPPIRVAAWDGAGFGSGKGSLADVVLRLAGADNIAADAGLATRGPPDVEMLLAAAPDLLVRGGSLDRRSLRANLASHPVVRRIWGADRTLTLRPAYYVCGTPFVAEGAIRLRAELRAKAGLTRTPLAISRANR